MDAEALRERISERNDRYRRELEDWYRSWLSDGFTARAAQLWKRDYSGGDAYERSIAPNRARWRALLNPPGLAISGPLEMEPLDWPGDPQVSFVRLPLGERLRAEAILATPESEGPWPLVIAQHGEEFASLKRHYERLGLADRCALDLHEGGHEVHIESGIAWLKKWV